jgi:peptide/nickel transport system permease protein
MGVAVPAFVLALAATAIFSLTPITAGIAIGMATAAQYALATAALGRSVLGEAYARAAVGLGAGPARIALMHVLPALIPVLRRHVASDAARAVAAYAGLAFIGLGADVGRPDWGAMVWEYRGVLFEAPWLLFGPVLATAWLATSLHLALD